jgi:hypothetical protein
MTEFTETQAQALIGTAEKMIEIWARLSPEKQQALFCHKRDGPVIMWHRLVFKRLRFIQFLPRCTSPVVIVD